MIKELSNGSEEISADIFAIGQIPIIPTLLDVICKTTGMGFACIARVTDNQWVACAVKDDISFGLQPGGELILETTLCHEVKQQQQSIIINHVSEDIDFCDHPTAKMYGFQSYISVPIFLKNKRFFGTLCAIDPRPADLKNDKVIGLFRSFVDLIAMHLDAFQQVSIAEEMLVKERALAELREQFVAILGHDLRNPVNAISNGAQFLLKTDLDSTQLDIVGIINRSTSRVTKIIDNVMDFARGKMGDGIQINRKHDEAIEKIIAQTVDEISIIHPQAKIKTFFNLAVPVNCDGGYLAQLLSNLLANAVKHGDLEGVIQINASSNAACFTLSVTNTGNKIPDKIMPHLFEPFYHGNVRPGQQGLGLGLYIVSEIAKAHGGVISVESGDDQTCFTLIVPL